MSAFRHALVIGKFYPPHSGHEYLIRAAADCADQATVVVMAADVESIALSQRVAWLEEIFASRSNVRITGVLDNVRIDYGDSAVWAEHVAHMRQGIAQAEAARTVAAGPVDAVFTSEPYGAELAQRLGAASVCLDQARELHAISATALRANPVAGWSHLAPCVRESLCQRVVIVGAESTGKSTLATALAAHYRERGGPWSATQCVDEYGREYTVTKLAVQRALDPAASGDVRDLQRLRWESLEFEAIAREQSRRESHTARISGPLLICDTDAFATGVWHERYLDRRSAAVESIGRQAPPRLGYILSSWRDVPFQQDGVRDGEHVREWMHERFRQRLTEERAEWLLVAGPLAARIVQCVDWIDARLAGAWKFADPLEKRA